jgi:predicted peptidase
MIFFLLIVFCITIFVYNAIVIHREVPAVMDTVPSEPLPEKPAPLNMDAGSHLMKYTDPESGYTMKYMLYIPKDATVDMPLIVFLHGIGEIGSVDMIRDNAAISNAHEVYGESFPFIILVPSCNASSWLKGKIPTTLSGVIKNTVSECKIDSKKISITGHSMGASAMYELLKQNEDYFCAAVAISPPNPKTFDVEVFQDIPFKAYAAAEESQCNYVLDKLVTEINEYEGKAQHITLEKFVHAETAYGAFSEELYEWILCQSLR